MTDESDLIQLQSITLGFMVLDGGLNRIKPSELIMKSMSVMILIDQIFLLYL